MNQKDIHVLDWSRIIQGNTAKQTHKGSVDDIRTVNKGILFEDMVEKLLMAMFPNEKWRRTAESHDGKRDFVYPAEEYLNDQKWAECKNYSSNLSLNVITPTLIMGAIENIEHIFFFSYSNLNDNAIEGLLRYSEMKKTSVKIFDGNLLESLICKYHATNGIEDFFPNTDFGEAYAALQKKSLRVIKTIRDLNGNIIPSTHLFELGERFYICAIIQNLTWESMDCTMSIQSNNDPLVLSDIREHKFLLSCSELREYSVLCQTLKAGNTNFIIKIASQDDAKKGIKKAATKITQKIKIIDEPYLAWSGENALNAWKLCLKHLSENENIPLFIAGESGTGKSTLMEILLREESVRERYKTARIDLSLSRNDNARILLSQVIGVQGKEKTPQEQLEEHDKSFSLLLDNYAKSAKEIASAIMKFYNRNQPYLFVIDNVDRISVPHISLIHELDSLARNEEKPISFLFILNESKKTIDEVLALFNWDKSFLNYKYKIVRLTKFDKKDILAYMKTRYGLEDIDSDFEGFEKEISPLELHSFCADLKNSGIITQAPNSKTYQIVDRFKFSEGIKHILYGGGSIKNICEKLDQNDISGYILKYLYITDKASAEMKQRYSRIIRNLIDHGVVKEQDGEIVFYHDEIRNAVGSTLTISEDNYIDIFDDRDTDHGSKAICALQQIARIKEGPEFLKSFFASNSRIAKITQRYDICWLIFENLEKLSDIGLLSAALRFVKSNYAALNEEHGHAAFFKFLKHAADSALRLDMNKYVDEEGFEMLAYFIKKYFDRALSTYNYQGCLDCFKKYEKRFTELNDIPSGRRAFWLSHYANRAAIALDRSSTPLMTEPDSVSALYDRSRFYCKNAGNHNELQLQIIVDDFYRNYVYQHNLTVELVQSTYEKLLQIKRNGLGEPMVLDYHLLLLEYLRFEMTNWHEDNMTTLLPQIREARNSCTTSFYTMKLYILELYILIGLKQFSDASQLLPHVFEFAYKKEMRSSIYKLTYIKAHLIIFQNNFQVSPLAYEQIVLALEQMLSTRGNMVNDLKREMFLVVRMAQIIAAEGTERLASFVCRRCDDSRKLLQALHAHIQGETSDFKELFEMNSYYILHGISFPTI